MSNTHVRTGPPSAGKGVESAQDWGALPRSGGRPVIEMLEGRVLSTVNHDVSDVLVHSGSESRRQASRIRARAFTVGRHIYLGSFGAGSGLAKQKLLTHELGHALNQPVGSGPSVGNVPRRAGPAEEQNARDGTAMTADRSGASTTGTIVGLDPLYAQVAADEVEALLGGSGGGRSPVRDAIDYLATLGMGDLVDTAVALNDRGTLERVAGGLRIGERTQVAGVLLTTIYVSAHTRATPSWGVLAASVVAALPTEERTDLLTEVLTSMGRGDEAASIAEGMEAYTESVEHRAAQPVDEVEADEPVQTMAGITPGPWNPGGQPIPFYIGNSAHAAIAAFYEASHAADLTFYNSVPISSIIAAAARVATLGASTATAAQRLLRPDIANVTRAHLYEIKPQRLLSQGITEAALYVAAFAAAGLPIALGPTAEPGTSGTIAAPGGWFVFRAPTPGVITYNYRQPRRRRVRVRVPHSAPEVQPVADEDFMKRMEEITGLTGIALIIYLIISEGSRLAFPPRNLVPVP